MAGKFLLSAVHWHSLTVAKGWWCQAFHGSCVGQRHKFQESDASFQDQVTPLLRGKSQLHGLRFADWDSDGDMDVLVAENESLSLWFYERLPGPGDSFKKHKLMPFWQSSFEVADWDGDGRPDLLVCSRTNSSSAGANVRFLKRDLFLAGGGADFIMLRKAPIILSTNETVCDMQAVDFDEDGDLDLALSDLYASSGRGGRWPTRRLRKYFERVSDEVSALEERTGEDNPLEAFADPVQQIADLDGDGRLDVLVQVGIQTWRCFRRTAAGTFVEQLEHPLMETPSLDGYPLHPWDLYVADWNSDGFPDVLFVIDSGSEMFGWEVLAYYQHVVDRDLRHNSHFKTYENIPLPSRANFIVEDWNEDGFDDVMVFSREELGRNESLTFRRYEYQPRDMKEVDAFSIPFKHSHTRDSDGLDNFALIDWDRDGALDLLFTSEDDGKVHFYRNLSDEPAEHPFKKIRLRKDSDQAWILALPMVVDWDNDGDFDLFLGPSDGRYFEQLADGSLHEWPLEQSPLMSAMKLLAPSYGSYRRRRGPKWQFLDCDADGDFDLIQVPHSKAPAQACEHDAGTHELRCGPDFLCLGTNVSRYQEGADHGRSFFSVLDGQLKLFVYKQDACEQGGRIELWTPGFCMPMNDPCHGKGYCLPGELRCRCIPGHEGADCSRCQPLFYTMHRKELQVQNCRPCPGDEFAGKVCYGRGTCFDDAMAKRLQQDSTAAWMAIGNGSCSCYEAFFYGTDQDGRSTCMEGHCPAGTEEVDGNCSFCPGGSSSDVGGVCKECPAGRVSKTSGSSTCEPCPAGTYESERQFCNACSPGKISREGSAACSPCDAGHFAKEAMVCELCPGGTFSPAGQSACQNCLPGTFSERGSINCPKCPAGTISQVAASACQACPVGTFEINKQVCSPCPPGTVSAVGTAGRDCSPCRAGRFAVAGALTCEQCPNGTISAARSSQCRGCPAGKFSQAGLICERCPFGTVSDAVAGFCQPCDAGRFAKRALTCEPCPGGTFADPNSSSCQKCDLGHVSLPNSPKCRSCNDLLVRAVPDATGQTCQVKTLDIVFGLICWMTAAGFSFLFLTGFFGRFPISDISSQGDRMVITTSMAHFFLKWADPVVSFTGTGVPDLDSTPTWKVRALNSYQLTLHGEEASMPLDTSTGHMRLNFPRPFLSMGIWRCPLLAWCLFFAAVTAGVASQVTLSLTGLACGWGFWTGLQAFTLRRRQGERTPLAKRRRQFLRELPLPVARCDRGPDRSMTAGQLLDFVQFFEIFIKERSMYYVCSNIVKPLTEPFQVSFVELVGPTGIQWFVSHYWGMPVRHFSDAIRKHAQCCEGDWRGSAYWICTFSNSQWHVKDELGHGKWQESSFYLALRSPDCQGTAMIIDELVLPLQRIWCLFEVYQTISLSQSDCFQGLLLCTSAGVLQQGNAGTDVAVAVAKTVADLDTRSAEATEESDRLMIHTLIQSMPGGFDAMNTFVRETICKALEASHLHYEATLKSLMQNLTSRVSPSGPLPTLLTSRAQQAETKSDASDTS